MKLSRPVWGAWIEMLMWSILIILKFCRAPYGARGLKCQHKDPAGDTPESRPVRGAGVDMMRKEVIYGTRPVWGAWIAI